MQLQQSYQTFDDITALVQQLNVNYFNSSDSGRYKVLLLDSASI